MHLNTWNDTMIVLYAYCTNKTFGNNIICIFFLFVQPTNCIGIEFHEKVCIANSYHPIYFLSSPFHISFLTCSPFDCLGPPLHSRKGILAAKTVCKRRQRGAAAWKNIQIKRLNCRQTLNSRDEGNLMHWLTNVRTVLWECCDSDGSPLNWVV